MKKVFKFFPLIIFLALIGIQFVHVERTNPPVNAELKAPPEIKTVLRNSCYDCHSNETKWPWYSYVAPVSWLITDHVNEGRRHLNFSEWEKLPEKKKAKLKSEIWDEVSEDAMPIKQYTYLHANSALNLNQKNLIKKWVDGNSLW